MKGANYWPKYYELPCPALLFVELEYHKRQIHNVFTCLPPIVQPKTSLNPHQTRNNFVVPLTFWGNGLRKKIRGPLINLFNKRPDYQLLCFTVHFMHDLGRALKPYMPMESTCKQFSFSKGVIPLGL